MFRRLDFNDFCNMIFSPKEELLPPVTMPVSTDNHVPYYTPSQPETNVLAQQPPVLQGPPVPPEPDDKIQQLELVSHMCVFVNSEFESILHNRLVAS